MPASPPHSPAPSGIVRPSTRSGSRLSMSGGGGSRQYVPSVINGVGRAPSRASGEDEEGLKTAVRVAVRIRPPLRPTDPGYDLIPQRFQRSMAQTMSDTTLAIDSPQGRKVFVFDRIFGPDIQQEGVWDYLQDSINAFVQGYNVSILAYGQSGAGKSYTMGTSDPNEQMSHDTSGVIPRAASALFEKLSPVTKSQSSGIKTPSRYSTPLPTLQKQSVSQERSWSMKATYVEIYNEQLRDLLLSENTPVGDRRQVNIREDTKGRILLTGLQEMQIESVDDLLAALNFGSSIRQTDATAINAKSSRSHAVFSINLIQRKPRSTLGREMKEKRYSAPADISTPGADGFITVDSKLHFVDLAGSERLKNTGAHGDRAKEGISINAGLASLGKVISQLSSRQAGSHVSYRDSKLTRLLQDSLGGNAFTYMVACVNPAEFHLSETLNTVQYAQRARAIQSKPQIQEVSVDGDLRALVDRLRAEIAFLRDQIRSSDVQSNRSNRHSVDRSTEKEVELQNQILDIQENYSALSQRHAKLISEITKARDSDTSAASVRPSDVVEDRLARSNSFAEAVEQVVLEYEKTIQSLEASLSSTRSNLSVTESSLLEKESKLVYLETINSQLQSRVQKLTDRESSTEVYLSDLENKLNGHTFGEERSSAVISELRKEINRVRENEASCEDYISTLEERLAEADQSMEIMQRELERLEHVVERQRSLGKLDNLLHELDTLTHIPTEPGAAVDGKDSGDITEHGRSENSEMKKGHPLETDDAAPINSAELSDTKSTGEKDIPDKNPQALNEGVEVSVTSNVETNIDLVEAEASRKLERAAQELDHYRKLYHSTMTDFTDMTARYEGALRDLHELQDQLDEHRHGRNSLIFTNVDDMPPPSPQSVSTPIVEQISSSTIGDQTLDSHETSKEPMAEPPLALAFVGPGDRQRQASTEASDPKETSDDDVDELGTELNVLEAQYLTLQDEHKAVLELVDELKNTISKSRADGVTSPTGAQVLRRKSSQNLIATDRANRAFKGLRSIATQYLDGNDDVMDVFDININAAVHELQSRSERIQELEGEVAGLRKDAEAKTAMINGLARERSSITSSPMDISVVSSLQSRLAEREGELQKIHTKLKAREEAYQQEVLSLRTHLEEAQLSRDLSSNGDLSVKNEKPLLHQNQPSGENSDTTMNGITIPQNLLDSADGRDSTPSEALESLISLFGQLIDLTQPKPNEDGNECEKASIQSPISAWCDILSRIKSRLENGTRLVVEQERRLEDYNEGLRSQHDLISEMQIALNAEPSSGKGGTTEFNEEGPNLKFVIHSLNALLPHIHALKLQLHELQEEKLVLQSELDSEKIQAENHQEEISELNRQLGVFGDQLHDKSQDAQDITTKATLLEQRALELETLNKTLKSELEELMVQNKSLMDELSTHLKALEAQKALVKELQQLHTLSQQELDELIKKEASHAGVIDQLEQQLANTYDQHQDSQKRLLETEEELRASHVEKAEILANHEASAQTNAQEIEGLMSELNTLQIKLADAQLELASLPAGVAGRTQRSNSVSSTNLRKSASTASLPSPPPVIPLPPLPAGQTTTAPAASSAHPIPPSTPTVSRRPSKDYVATHLEDQEARIKTLEKQLQAEKALTATLEEALTDCEKTMKKLNSDKEIFQRKANQAQQELDRTRTESQSSRYSMQAMEDERLARLKAEKAKEALEERMQALSSKKKSRNFACF